ncbi:MAG: hypothetical protein IT179_14420 [Acidobacteria bacterium]|nr:hypothetical protein [Acidobacteriota bacterium]
MTRDEQDVWRGWMVGVLAACRDAAGRAILEESQLADVLDADDVRPVLVLDLALGRADVWFKGQTRGTSIHAGSIHRDGTWHPAALAPAVARAPERAH